jgi:hypothetical protein
MIQRLQKKTSGQKVPSSRDRETPETPPTASSKLLSGRAAAIISASFAIAICAGTLTYLTAGKRGESLAEAILVGAAAFAGAIRLLDSIIG